MNPKAQELVDAVKSKFTPEYISEQMALNSNAAIKDSEYSKYLNEGKDEEEEEEESEDEDKSEDESEGDEKDDKDEEEDED